MPAREQPPNSEDRLARLHDDLVTAVAALTDSAAWRRMLQTAVLFPDYSPSNVLLIATQRPDATRVAGLRTWNRLGRHVLRGEHGIAILAPCTYPPKRPGPAPEPTRANGPEASPPAPAPAQDDAAPELSTGALRGFRVVHVFDISQTDGTPLPDVAPVPLSGDAPARLWDQLAAQVEATGHRLEIGPCPTGVNGFTDPTAHLVRVTESLEPAQAAKTLAHELAHVRAEHTLRFPNYALDQRCRGIAEVEAESIAYLVTATAGLDSLPYTVPYVASWSGGDLDTLRTSATTVIRTAQAITHELHLPAPPESPAPSTRVAPEPTQPGRAHLAVPTPEAPTLW